MYQQVCDEVKGSPVFLMRLCSKARHIEVQLMCDKHRNVAVLSGRDCSMQREPRPGLKLRTWREAREAGAKLPATTLPPPCHRPATGPPPGCHRPATALPPPCH